MKQLPKADIDEFDCQEVNNESSGQILLIEATLNLVLLFREILLKLSTIFSTPSCTSRQLHFLITEEYPQIDTFLRM